MRFLCQTYWELNFCMSPSYTGLRLSETDHIVEEGSGVLRYTTSAYKISGGRDVSLMTYIILWYRFQAC